MKNLEEKITGYVWYNRNMGLYQKGTKKDYDQFLEASGSNTEFSLILKLTNESDIVAYKIVKELNNARIEHDAKLRIAV